MRRRVQLRFGRRSMGGLTLALALAALFVWAACARVRPLEGGPPDQTAPSLVRVSPPDSAVSLPMQPRFVLEFDEPVAEGPMRRAIRFEPPRRIRDVDVRGRRVTIELADSLPPDTTFTLVVGKAAQDLPLRNNRLAAEIRIVYATGNRIRGGGVTGRVTARGKADARLVVAWLPARADTGRTAPRRARTGPVAAADPEGLFRLAGLPAGQPFRLLGFLDANDDLVANEGELQAPYPDTLVLAEGEIRRGLSWNLIDVREPGEWTGVVLNATGVAGAVAFAARNLDAAPDNSRRTPVDTLGAPQAAPGGPASELPGSTVTPAPASLPIAPRDSSAWGAAYAQLGAAGFVRQAWSVVYASPRGDYSLRVGPGRVTWLAFVDAQRDSMPGPYAGADSTRFDWEPLVIGDTVLVAPGERVRRRSIEIR